MPKQNDLRLIKTKNAKLINHFCMASIPLQVSGGVTVMVEIWKTAFGAREKTTDIQLKTTW